MIVLGIDPGVATIGFGVVRAERQKNTLVQYGVITTPPGIPLSSRLLQISDDMEELIRTFHPDEMAVEELFFTKTSPPASRWPTAGGSSSSRRSGWGSPSLSTPPCR